MMIWCRCEDSQVGTHSTTPFPFLSLLRPHTDTKKRHWSQNVPSSSMFFLAFLVVEKGEYIFIRMDVHAFLYQYSEHDTLEGLLTQLNLLVLSFWLFPFGCTMYTFHTYIIYYLYFALFSFFLHIHQRECFFYWKNESVWYGMVHCNILFLSFFAYFEWKVGCCCQMLTHAPFSVSGMYESLFLGLYAPLLLRFATFSFFVHIPICI